MWHLYNQCFATRIYVISAAIALLFLILLTSLSYTTETVIINQPSVIVYLQLERHLDSETLVCPCTSISNQYENFVSFQPTLHQICSSVFLSQNWLNYLFLVTVVLYGEDFRWVAFSFSQTLTLFCDLSLETITSQLITFNSTIYATKNVQRSDLFLSQTQQIMSLFEQTTRNSFLLQIAMFRQTMTNNALFSAWLTNFFYKYLNATDSSRLVFYPFFYTSEDNDANTTCSCKFAPDKCDESTGIYNASEGKVRYVPFH